MRFIASMVLDSGLCIIGVATDGHGGGVTPSYSGWDRSWDLRLIFNIQHKSIMKVFLLFTQALVLTFVGVSWSWGRRSKVKVARSSMALQRKYRFDKQTRTQYGFRSSRRRLMTSCLCWSLTICISGTQRKRWPNFVAELTQFLEFSLEQLRKWPESFASGSAANGKAWFDLAAG